MNDTTSTELKVIVEPAVRPVRATMARKRRMREELLAHLVSAFQEQAKELGDGQAALDAARKRFGDPRELSGELQAAVPIWDRAASWNEKLLQYQPGETLPHFAQKAPSAHPGRFLYWPARCAGDLGNRSATTRAWSQGERDGRCPPMGHRAAHGDRACRGSGAPGFRRGRCEAVPATDATRYSRSASDRAASGLHHLLGTDRESWSEPAPPSFRELLRSGGGDPAGSPRPQESEGVVLRGTVGKAGSRRVEPGAASSRASDSSFTVPVFRREAAALPDRQAARKRRRRIWPTPNPSARGRDRWRRLS